MTRQPLRLRALRAIASAIVPQGAPASNFPERQPRRRAHACPNKCRLSPVFWEDFEEDRCLSSTRFSKLTIEYLVVLLRIKNPLVTRNRIPIDANIALSIFLARLTSSGRLVDLETVFGFPALTISHVVNQLSRDIFDRWTHRILTGFNTQLLNPIRLELYSAAVVARGCPIPNVYGFVDVTFHMISRPKRKQRVCYNGYKAHHALKYNCVATPDGLFAHCSLPVEGRRADSTVLALSGLEAMLEEHAWGVHRQRMYLYGDPAYATTDTIISAAKNQLNMSEHEQEFYTAMSRGRIAVEWGFGKLFSLFPHLQNVRSNRLLLSPIGCHFLNAVLFMNLHTCLNGSVTSKTFNCAPPSVEDYLRL